MEKPSLNDIRDACADLVREDQSEEDDNSEEEKSNSQEISKQQKNRFHRKTRPGEVPDVWVSKREREAGQREMLRKQMQRGDTSASTDVAAEQSQQGGAFIDFGEVDDEGQFKVKKIRIKICGRSIWNYPSEKSMKRGGWLQYSIVAKDSTLNDAMELCRSWDEFFELSIIALHGYFPSAQWNSSYRYKMDQQFVNLVS